MATHNTPDRKYAPVAGLQPAQVYVVIGDGVTLGVNADDRLVLEDPSIRVDLGRCYHGRLDHLKEMLERLRPHAIENPS